MVAPLKPKQIKGVSCLIRSIVNKEKDGNFSGWQVGLT